ncbi:DUF4118 domain-containing protein [Sphingomonas humi]|uniref:OmpR/PhoB-type domain-containing protein n=1 Tax=Sphingomonas humi TaxID=335630 RepID=A0ABP7S028_9SPHN
MTRTRLAASPLVHLIAALLMVGVSTLGGLIIAPRYGNSAVDLLYLPAVLGAAVVGGFGPALLAAAAAALSYNFFFTQPHFTFRVTEANDLLTIVVLLGVALATSQLAAGIRRQAERANGLANRNATIAGLARRLLSCTGEEEIAAVGASEVARVFDCNALLIPAPITGAILAAAPHPSELGPNDWAAAELALQTGEPTGRGVSRAVPTEWQFRPVRSGTKVLAIMAIARDDGSNLDPEGQLKLLDNLLDQVALALERGRLEGEMREFTRVHERDRLRSALFSTIGQDVQPTLVAIGKAVRDIRREGGADRTLLGELGGDVAKLERYLMNLLSLDDADDQRPVVSGEVSIDLFRREVRRSGEPVHLTPKEYGLLAELARQPGRVLSHAHLLRSVWGPAHEGNSDYLRVAVRGLRQKLEDDPKAPRLIVNEPAVGYRLNV